MLTLCTFGLLLYSDQAAAKPAAEMTWKRRAEASTHANATDYKEAACITILLPSGQRAKHLIGS